MMIRDERLVFPIFVLFVGLLSFGVQFMIVLDFLNAAESGHWNYYMLTHDVDPPAKPPESFCFGFCYPRVPFFAGWFGLGCVIASLASLMYIYWRPRSPTD